MKDASISDVDSVGRLFRRFQQKNSVTVPESSESSSSPLCVRDVETREEDSGRRFRGFRLKKKCQNLRIFAESSLRPALGATEEARASPTAALRCASTFGCLPVRRSQLGTQLSFRSAANRQHFLG